MGRTDIGSVDVKPKECLNEISKECGGRNWAVS